MCPDEASSAEHQLIDSALSNQQLLISYDHSFFIAALTVLLCGPIVLAIRYKKQPPSKDMDMAH
jgi:DHA2 family multidrug resistance protein